MNLSNISVIFIIIIIPVILVASYYMTLQIDTINMQTSYNGKQLEATKEAIEAFEINTVEWNADYSSNQTSKRRDVMASVNTFITNFANGIGVGGTSKENILAYVPAIACTLYDGYYIYSPAETKDVLKDENGVARVVPDPISNKAKAKQFEEDTGITPSKGNIGKIVYIAENGGYTLNPDDAKSSYSHILKPYATYSARYKTGNIDITVNYTLDNYITIYGMVGSNYVVKSVYLINGYSQVGSENLSETIAWKWDGGEDYTKHEYNYVYAEDNTKIYFEENNDNYFTAFRVNANGIRTDLTDVVYKKKATGANKYIYQALNSKDDDGIVKGQWYNSKNNKDDKNNDYSIGLTSDVSANNYYIESRAFSNWVYANLSGITIGNIQGFSDEDKAKLGDSGARIFEDPDDEDSVFNKHKSEIIKQSLISSLNQAITSYGRKSAQEYRLPVLTETDWDQILRNVCMVTFVQGLPMGMKYYNNYTVATSTANNEFINPDQIYITGNGDNYYHKPYCEKCETTDNLIGYRNTDYITKTYPTNDTTEDYYKHENLANQACYYCLVQPSLYKEAQNDAQKIAYEKALARERYNKRNTQL